MPRAEFAIVSFHEHLGDHKDDVIFKGTVFVGDRSSEKEFHIEGVPVGKGYVVMQLAHYKDVGHEVLLNGEPAGGEPEEVIVVVGQARTSATGMAVFDAKLLKRGRNTIQIRRADGSDNFAVYAVAIHWREKEPVSDVLRSIMGALSDAKVETKVEQAEPDKPDQPDQD